MYNQVTTVMNQLATNINVANFIESDVIPSIGRGELVVTVYSVAADIRISVFGGISPQALAYLSDPLTEDVASAVTVTAIFDIGFQYYKIRLTNIGVAPATVSVYAESRTK